MLQMASEEIYLRYKRCEAQAVKVDRIFQMDVIKSVSSNTETEINK